MTGFAAKFLSLSFSVVLLIFLGATALAQTADEWVTRANQHYEAGRFAESADAYDRAIRAGIGNRTTFYNAACSAALASRVDAAFAHLDSALVHGWRDHRHLLRDSDLEALHGDSRWSGVIARCQQAEADYLASLKEPELREELLEMFRIDQAILRGEDLPELEGKNKDGILAANMARMKAIVAEYGWPTISMVGRRGANAAWLLVQHSDEDVAFQRQCLELMQAVPVGEVSRVDLAYLTDRVLVNEGKKQIYGTQFHEVDGKMVPRPIEDEAGLAARRAELGMISMEEYAAIMNRGR